MVNFNFLEYSHKSDSKEKFLRRDENRIHKRVVKPFLSIVLNYVTHLIKLLIWFFLESCLGFRKKDTRIREGLLLKLIY